MTHHETTLERSPELQAAMARLSGNVRAYDGTKALLENEIRRVLSHLPSGRNDVGNLIRESVFPDDIAAIIAAVASDDFGYKVTDVASALTIIKPDSEEAR